MKVGVSIVVCCYNSKNRIEPTLLHLAKQQVNIVACEVIVVDNNSNDDTGNYAQLVWQKFDTQIPFRVIYEPKSGLSNAREAGIFAAKYDYVLFCDDDNWLCDSYARDVFNLFENYPKAGLVGGWNTPVSETVLPNWFESVQVYYAMGALYPETQEFGGIIKGVFGAGMGVRKRAYLDLKKIGFSFSLLDRKKNALSGGGDIELRIVMGLLGYTCVYSKSLYLQHFVPVERQNKDYVKRLAYEWGKTIFAVTAYNHHYKGRKSVLFWYLASYLKSVLSLLKSVVLLPFSGLKGYCVFLERKAILIEQSFNSSFYFNLRKNIAQIFQQTDSQK